VANWHGDRNGRRRSAPAWWILSSDYYDGNASLSTDTLITQGLITPSTPIGTLDVANANLLNYIQSLYLPNGRPTARFAVFRANPDIHLPIHSDPYRGYVMATADNSDRSLIPRLTLGVATVPEPTTIVAWGFGMLLVGSRFGRARSPMRR
jgi:hypothetical protein